MKSRAADQILITGNAFVLCDVRCGPTEDKMAFDVEHGTYSLSVAVEIDSVCITICKNDIRRPRHGDELGEIAIDGGTLGIYDPELFQTVFGADAEEFYEWGDSLFEVSDEVRVYRDNIEPYEFACIPTFGDGVFQIVELLQADSRVGLSLRASMAMGTGPEDSEKAGVETHTVLEQQKANSRFRIRLECQGIPAASGPALARDVAKEFADHHQHSNVTCTWDGSTLALEAENDFDSNGEALLDAFSEYVFAREEEAVGASVVSIVEF